MRAGCYGRSSRADGVQQLRAGDENDARAGERQEHTARTGIKIEIMMGPFNGADGNRVGDQPRFGAGLDREKSTDFAQHRHSLTPERFERSFEPFGS